MNAARALFDLCKQSFASWRADYAPSMGAALAYYTVFSVAPLLLIVISVVGLVFGREEARGEIFEQLSGLMGAEGARAVQIMLEALNKPRQGIVATVIGVALLLVGATTVFGELQDAFDRIWRAPAREDVNGLLDLMRARLLSFSMIMGIGFLLIVSLVVNAALAALGEWWAPVFGGWATLAQNVNSVFGFVIVTVGFAMIFKVMPRVRVQWRDVWIGAVVTAVLFTIGKYLIGLYIGKTGIASGYGAAGSLVVLLVWVYYSAQIFLLGVEFTWVYAHAYGSFKGRPRPAARASPTRAEQST
ncbi:YihY/virulence factor BrkB family protein [Variovorax sp. J22P240]|uniref:YihY/virulence factor BrkB family protein n=1 Tax=unclassified Variovorax TaxID=663243 RepID=UPI0025758EFC|nr:MULTISPECIES: YihY/virulence factor BrkB family protein [unclassified Variovorax]MDL9997377.1 YihY/virulence factor BrkB family protein [Variovorax sp. J22P240]MDM0048027.1 YihY/virulence factor BrkB family protein [Variovorax sp. J22R115]